jgi:hypothetical protein
MSSTVASNGGTRGKESTLESANTEHVDTNGSVGGPGGSEVEGEGDRGAEGGSGPFNLTDQQKRVLVVVLVVHLILAKVTWLDLRRRPQAGVRGPKRFWRTWSLFNTTGSFAYWTVGRRRLRGE